MKKRSGTVKLIVKIIFEKRKNKRSESCTVHIEPEQLEKYLAEFIRSVRQKDGED